MTEDAAGPGNEADGSLADVDPSRRVEMVLAMIRDHPEGRLVLGDAAMLDEVDLGPSALRALLLKGEEDPAWWDGTRKGAALRRAELPGAKLRRARLRSADLGGANLRGASLGNVDLRGARLEGADLSGADLAEASMAKADLGQADLREALIEDADLRGANLRFADLRGAALEQSKLGGADLWSARLELAVLAGADLRRAILREADLPGADLRGANLRHAALSGANFLGADLSGVDFRCATMSGLNLEGAKLADARLEHVDLSTCRLDGVHLGGAYLDRTRFRLEQLGGALGEERDGQFAAAARGYLALERNFTDLGDPDAASWAYRRRRRMQKRAAGVEAREAFAARRWKAAIERSARYASDQAVEWLCDYGESVLRVLATMLVVYALFTVLYGVTGSVFRVDDGPRGPIKRITRNPLELAIFSLLAMTTSGSPAVGLEPSHEFVHLLTGLQASLGIALTGLLGFVLGNRVRR